MNMYTEPAYRQRGIVRRTLDLLVQEARNLIFGNAVHTQYRLDEA